MGTLGPAPVSRGKPEKRAVFQRPKRKEPEPGQCVACRCTDAEACPEGCEWANEAHTVCTACVDPECLGLDAKTVASRVKWILSDPAKARRAIADADRRISRGR